MKWLIPILLFVGLSYADQSNLMLSIPLAGSEGLFDKFGADVIPDNASPDLQNVYVDKDVGIVSRKGYSKYFSTTTFHLGDFPVKQLYEYIQSNGARYRIAICSGTAYWVTDTSSGVIKSGLSDYDHWICTWQDKLYVGDMADIVWNWDGTTVNTSTSIPKCEFATTWGQRLLLGREIDNGSILYETLNNSDVIDEITSDGYELISPDDGDTITAIRLYQGQVIVWKKSSMWKIVGTYFGNCQVYNISKEVGCLDGGSIQEHRGTLKWLSHKGIIQYDGNSIGIISTPIDTIMDNVAQKKVSKFSYGASSDNEFNVIGSSIVNLSISNGEIYPNVFVNGINQQQTYRSTALALITFNYPSVRQSFQTTLTRELYQIDLSFWKEDEPTGDFQVCITSNVDNFAGVLVSSITPLSRLPSEGAILWYSYTINPTITLNSDTTYFIRISSYTGSYSVQLGELYIEGSKSNLYARGCASYWNGSGWTDWSGWDIGFKIYLTTGQYAPGLWTSPVKNLGVANWGMSNIKEQEFNGYTFNHYIKVSSATNNFNSTPMQSLLENNIITATTGQYIQIISSFVYVEPTATNDTDISAVQCVYVNYGTDSVYYQSCASAIYDDRYWLSVSTIGDNSNSLILIQDQRDKWIKFVGINAYSLGIFNQKLYSGSSDNTGHVYLQDTGYNDDGNAIDSYYTTKSFSLGELYKKKLFNAIWTTVKTSSGTLYIDYKIDNTTSSWKGMDGSNTATKLNLNDTSASVIFSKNSFRFLPQGRYIQFRIRNNILDEYFTLKNLSLIYGVRELDY